MYQCFLLFQMMVTLHLSGYRRVFICSCRQRGGLRNNDLKLRRRRKAHKGEVSEIQIHLRKLDRECVELEVPFPTTNARILQGTSAHLKPLSLYCD